MLEDALMRAAEQLVGRLSGPLSFRLVLQPTMASILAILAGLRDAKAGQPAYLWTIISARADRRALLRDGWRDIGRLGAVAVAIDALYQLVEFHWFYPAQALLIAILLAIVPYVLIRGPVNRLASGRRVRV
jgi:hypothetical protein